MPTQLIPGYRAKPRGRNRALQILISNKKGEHRYSPQYINSS